MRRYLPRIHVVESANGVYFDYNLRKEFSFPETEFMAVTQYRNKQIAKLKIDANPFATAYRSYGLHGQAKRRRLESMAACEDWKTPEDGPPSNSSSMEGYPLVNDDEPDVENNSFSGELVDKPSTSDKRQVNGTSQASPSQTGMHEDTSADAQVSIEDRGHNQESVSIVLQVTQNQSTDQTNESESQLMCEESTEWMWGFDEQISLRYASENHFEDFDMQEDSPKNASQNTTDVNEATKATVNRRKKYLPRKLPRTSTVSSTNVSLGYTDSEERKEIESVNGPTVDHGDLLSSQPNNTISICGDDGKTDHSCGTDVTTIPSPASPCFEPAVKPSFSCNNLLRDPETAIDCHTDAIISRFCTATGLISVSGQDGSNSACNVSGETSVTPANSSLSSEPGDSTASSLNALIQMCSEAGGSSGSRKSARIRGMVTRSISKKLDGIPGRKDVSPEERAEAGTCLSEESQGSVTPKDGHSLFKQPAENSITTSRCQPCQESDYNLSVSLASGIEGRVRPSLIPTSSSSSGRVISSATTSISAVASSSSNRSRNYLINDTVNKSPTTTYPCQTGSTAVTGTNPSTEHPFPIIVDTFSGYYIANGSNSGQLPENKQQGYRPIVPAPSQSVNVCSDEPARDASVTSSCCSNSINYPIIVDSFSINENFLTAVAHRSFKYKILESQRQARFPNSGSQFRPSQTSPPPQVNRGYFSSPYSNQTGQSGFNALDNQTGQSGFIALDNTVLMQAFSLEKFYSFSAPDRQAPSPPLRPQTRYYKTTRTNFSRLSLEPICSVIHPLNSSSL